MTKYVCGSPSACVWGSNEEAVTEGEGLLLTGDLVQQPVDEARPSSGVGMEGAIGAGDGDGGIDD